MRLDWGGNEGAVGYRRKKTRDQEISGKIHQRRRVEETTLACRAMTLLAGCVDLFCSLIRHPTIEVYPNFLCNARKTSIFLVTVVLRLATHLLPTTKPC